MVLNITAQFMSAVLVMLSPRFWPSQACWCRGKCWKYSLDAVGALLHDSQNTAVFSGASQPLLQITGSEGCWGENDLCLSQSQCLKTVKDFVYKWIVLCVISGISQFHLGWSLQEWVLGSFGGYVCVVIFLVVINDPFFCKKSDFCKVHH